MERETTGLSKMLQEYIKSLTEREYKAYMIAKSHLESSFDLEKSIGYKEWKKNQKLSGKDQVRFWETSKGEKRIKIKNKINRFVKIDDDKKQSTKK